MPLEETRTKNGHFSEETRTKVGKVPEFFWNYFGKITERKREFFGGKRNESGHFPELFRGKDGKKTEDLDFQTCFRIFSEFFRVFSEIFPTLIHICSENSPSTVCATHDSVFFNHSNIYTSEISSKFVTKNIQINV